MDGIDGVFIARAAAFIGAAIVMGLGGLGPAIGQGMTGKSLCDNIGKYPESSNKIRISAFLAMGIMESTAIFAFIIALWLIGAAK